MKVIIFANCMMDLNKYISDDRIVPYYINNCAPPTFRILDAQEFIENKYTGFKRKAEEEPVELNMDDLITKSQLAQLKQDNIKLKSIINNLKKKKI